MMSQSAGNRGFSTPTNLKNNKNLPSRFSHFAKISSKVSRFEDDLVFVNCFENENLKKFFLSSGNPPSK